jgi:hypothetical protein
MDLSKMGLRVCKASKTFTQANIVAFGANQDANDEATGITIPAGSLVLSAEVVCSGDVANTAKMDDIKIGAVDLVGAADAIDLQAASTSVVTALRQLSGAVTCSFTAGENFTAAADETVQVNVFYVDLKAV